MLSGSQVKCIDMSGLWEIGKQLSSGCGDGPEDPSLNVVLLQAGLVRRKKLDSSIATFLCWQMNGFSRAVLLSSPKGNGHAVDCINSLSSAYSPLNLKGGPHTSKEQSSDSLALR